MKNFVTAGLIFLFFFVVGYFIGNYDFGSNSNSVKRERILMGTVIEIIIRDVPELEANEAINKAFDEISRIDNIFSSYNDISNVYTINKNLSEEIVITPEIYFVLSKCDEIYKTTNGAFDVSTGNIIKLWDFAAVNPAIPNDSSLAVSLSNSGWKNVELKNDSILIKKKNVSFNFGAIAKGYAVDCAAKVLSDLNITEYLINAGGEIRTSGKNWKIGIQHPRKTNEILKTLLIENVSVATSGDYEQYFEIAGKRYHHIINPANGYPANGCQSVTIIADDDLTADAYATGIFVMGFKNGMELIERKTSIEGMIISDSGEVFLSSGFNKYVWR
ncbi:MAG: FAD:protein FMN transferase [Ignavibacteriaceae bacterium]|nr:FAD:protein FMN transferase [Ignavibacteriaceae bacterium]